VVGVHRKQKKHFDLLGTSRPPSGPINEKNVIRGGFGMYNDLQDALGYRADQNAPFNPTYGSSAGGFGSYIPETSAAG
jgi:hypothetical protein